MGEIVQFSEEAKTYYDKRMLLTHERVQRIC
jgi:hypothetical protein